MPPLTLQEAAALAGRHAWWEQRLYELAGRWAADDRDATVTVALAVQAGRHAARAERWHRRLPVLAGWAGETLTVAPHPALPAAVERLHEGAAGTLERLVAFYRVLLPARLAAYRTHLERTSPVCDGPAVRVLDAAVAALALEIATGEQLLDTADGAAHSRTDSIERRCRSLLSLD